MGSKSSSREERMYDYLARRVRRFWVSTRNLGSDYG